MYMYSNSIWYTLYEFHFPEHFRHGWVGSCECRSRVWKFLIYTWHWRLAVSDWKTHYNLWCLICESQRSEVAINRERSQVHLLSCSGDGLKLSSVLCEINPFSATTHKWQDRELWWAILFRFSLKVNLINAEPLHYHTYHQAVSDDNYINNARVTHHVLIKNCSYPLPQQHCSGN